MLVLVDEKDNVLGLMNKDDCHKKDGLLHRGFIIFILNKKGNVLIQKRSRYKKLWPLYWDASCAGHPYKSETYERAGERRLKEELGFSCKLNLLSTFRLRANYKGIGSENEICAVLFGNYDGYVVPNPHEVAEWKWVDLEKLKEMISKHPEEYTPWLKIALPEVISRGSFH